VPVEGVDDGPEVAPSPAHGPKGVVPTPNGSESHPGNVGGRGPNQRVAACHGSGYRAEAGFQRLGTAQPSAPLAFRVGPREIAAAPGVRHHVGGGDGEGVVEDPPVGAGSSGRTQAVSIGAAHNVADQGVVYPLSGGDRRAGIHEDHLADAGAGQRLEDHVQGGDAKVPG
jgi:hypothetical protein